MVLNQNYIYKSLTYCGKPQSQKKIKKKETAVLSALSKHILDVLFKDYGFPINERTLSNYFNDLEKNDGEAFRISTNITNELSKYLGYKDLRDYSKGITTKKKRSSLNKYVIAGLVVVATYFGIDATSDKCMIWKEDRFEKISCEENNAKPINEGLLTHFKKINPKCDYLFFDNKGDVQVWYGKNFNEELEFFNQLGVHPFTGKTLKPITDHMINKYICK